MMDSGQDAKTGRAVLPGPVAGPVSGDVPTGTSLQRPGHPPLSEDGRAEVRPSRMLGWWRVLTITVWTFYMILRYLPKIFPTRGLPPHITMRWHRRVLKLAGIDVELTGLPVLDRPVLMVANHASYIDIIALGAHLPCSFVAKTEVKSWPVFGWMAVQQRTVFVDRDPRKAAPQLENMKQRLAEGGCLVLFPEGTSTEGGRVLPFKSSLFQAASIDFPGSGQIEVQPVSISYSRMDGMPLGRAFRPFFTWFGDMELAPHLIDWLGLGKLGIDIVFHEPIRLEEAGGRKALARLTHQATADGLQSALKGEPRAQSISPRLLEGAKEG
ncbi:1-acyl-sn-glycerol-3-phosphate acyltransferase [Rhodospirillaceae bacterium KN72]|uniref:1-acyl-sn-glycerol-3-phosphate acyltransferase n=1 Tax=Pacificispira spongiicola TaxID=2729598 RepID=A0A7Y0HEK6_9PROT|nr:lysophospholipid acyltransferase family protein [Pacificispira spongiicola]NMM44961.1 1-acyl-sn-glycerol-3-phosphate acyltransferase [Pacificispira spongiicola]